MTILTFENYLIMVGIRAAEYTYTDEQIMDNTEYFRKCYNDNLSEYKALLFLNDHLHKPDTGEMFYCKCTIPQIFLRPDDVQMCSLCTKIIK